MVSLDLPVTVFLAVCLYGFLLGALNPPGKTRLLYLLCASFAAALAVLTKGLIGIVFPCAIIGIWIALMNEWRLLKQLYLPSCIILFLLVATPWHVLVNWHNPEFFYFYFIEQHFLRYTMENIGHYQPAWFFIPCLIAGFFPWIIFLPQSIAANITVSWRLRTNYKIEFFLFIWALLIFAFFSFSKSKLIPYILPVFPPLAILTARYLSKAMMGQFKLGIRLAYIILVIFALVIAYVFYHFTATTSLPDIVSAKYYLNSAGIVLILGSSISCIYAFKKIRTAIITTIISIWLFLLIILAAMPAIDTRTILPLANQLTLILMPTDEVITYNQYYQDLPFYLQRRITILNWRNELSYGMQHQDTHAWMINDQTFWQRGGGR